MLDLLYGAAVGARRRWYERHPEARRRLRQPVISIGNLSFGGTGKTPVARLVAEHLLARDERPAILSRGYGRRITDAGATVVADGTRVLADFDHAGDEPLMLARAVPGAIVVVAEDRHLAGVLAEERLGATVHVLDDGFQHLRLMRDLDVLVTWPGEIPSGRVFPRGVLRERPAAAARAHVAVVMDTDEAMARSEAWALGVSQALGATRVVHVPAVPPAFAIAGIGNPDQFFDSLRVAGVDLRGTHTFRDHHRYDRRDLDGVAHEVRAVGAEVVLTTAKDAVKLEAAVGVPFSWTVVPLTLELDQASTLYDSIDAALARAREAA